MSGEDGSSPAHASLVAWRGAGGSDGSGDRAWDGVLIRGPSGSGKSTLALQALEAGARLVADDRVLLWRSGGAVYGRAPEVLRGLIEVRGVGIAHRAEQRPFARIRLVVDLAASAERLPEPLTTPLLGLDLPGLRLDIIGGAPLLRLRAALAALQRRL